MTAKEVTPWGKIISDIMKENKASQRQVAVQTGLNRTTIRRCLAGRSNFGLDDLDRISRLFGYEMDLIKVGQSNFVPLPHAGGRKPAKEYRIAEPQAVITKPAKKRLIIIRCMQRGAV